MSASKPAKVLVSSFAFNPIDGSECAVGWNYVRAIAARRRVWVMTRSLEREKTEPHLLAHPEEMPNVTVLYVGERFRNLGGPVGKITNFWRYQLWHWEASRLGRRLDKEIDFDLMHHVTGTGFREPGHLWKLGKPFVWGPVCGLQYIPMNLLNAVPLRSRPFFVLKNLSTAWSTHVSRRPRRAARAAKGLIAGSSAIAGKIKSLWGRDAEVCCEVTAPVLEPRPPLRRGPDVPLRIVWCGSCDPLKALNIVLLALEKLKGSAIDWRLIAVGDGPLLENWKQLARRLGLDARCKFLGRVSRAEVQTVMETGHCLVQPSIYDATTTVVAEALAHGLPVICLDHFGFGDAVDAESGIKIPPQTLKQVIQGFAAAIEAIASDEGRRYAMAIAAQRAAQRLSWRHKEKVINDVYGRILPAVALPSPCGERG